MVSVWQDRVASLSTYGGVKGPREVIKSTGCPTIGNGELPQPVAKAETQYQHNKHNVHPHREEDEDNDG